MNQCVEVIDVNNFKKFKEILKPYKINKQKQVYIKKFTCFCLVILIFFSIDNREK